MKIKQYFTIKIAITLLLVATCYKVHAQNFVPQEKGSRIEFSFQQGTGDAVKKVKGTFRSLYGLIQFDPKNLPKASFDISLSTGSLRSDQLNQNRLKGTTFFNVVKYPSMHLKSTSVTQDRPGGVVYLLSGLLTMKGVTKPVRIQFTASPYNDAYLFRGLLQFSREAFGIGESGEFDDNVTVFLQIAVKKQ